MQRLKNRDLEEKKAVLLAKLEEAELGERAALGEASRVREDNEGLKVSHRVGTAMMGFLQEKGKRSSKCSFMLLPRRFLPLPRIGLI